MRLGCTVMSMSLLPSQLPLWRCLEAFGWRSPCWPWDIAMTFHGRIRSFSRNLLTQSRRRRTCHPAPHHTGGPLGEPVSFAGPFDESLDEFLEAGELELVRGCQNPRQTEPQSRISLFWLRFTWLSSNHTHNRPHIRPLRKPYTDRV